MELRIYRRMDMFELVCVCRHPVYYKQNCMQSHCPQLCTILECVRLLKWSHMQIILIRLSSKANKL